MHNPFDVGKTATRLRDMRRDRGLTVAELARKSGLPKSAIEQYLAGRHAPGPAALSGLALALDVSVDWLIFGETFQSRRARA